MRTELRKCAGIVIILDLNAQIRITLRFVSELKNLLILSYSGGRGCWRCGS